MDKLLWIDLEMTGLDVKKEVIIEAAAVITDLEFNALDQYHAIVKQDQSYLDSMDQWNTQHHGDSGLSAAVPNGVDPEVVEQQLIELVEKHFNKDKPVLAGNSIHQDKLFIDKHFKKLASRLHYRMLDVSSFKVIFNHKYKKSFSKKGCHRAVDDILESIEELKYYLGFIQF
jgi:oligoribonuclease